MTQPDGSSSTRDIVSDTVSMVQLADDIGFDVAWFAEHHFSNYSICPSPLMMASYCAGLTKRIRLDPAVLVLSLYHPLRMTNEIGLLDVQSGGRAVIRIGSYQKFEFDRFQKLTNKSAVSMEISDILGMALREGAVDDAGKFFSVPPTPVAIKPLQRSAPEIFVTGLEPAVLRRVGRVFLSPWTCEPYCHGSLRRRPDEKSPLAVQQQIFVTDDRAEALDVGERARAVGRIVAQRGGGPILNGPLIQV